MNEEREPYTTAGDQAENVKPAQDDYSDLLAVADDPFRLLCEDHELMTGEAGNLGGTELV